MNPQALRWLCVTLVVMAGMDVGAQPTVYRCGPTGRDYSSSPCPGGKAVDVDDARSVQQRQQALDAARRDRGLAERLAAERRQRDADVERRGPARLDAAARVPAKVASKPASSKDKKNPRRPVDPNLSPAVRAASGSS